MVKLVGVSMAMGVPPQLDGLVQGKCHLQMDDLGVPPFQATPNTKADGCKMAQKMGYSKFQAYLSYLLFGKVRPTFGTVMILHDFTTSLAS